MYNPPVVLIQIQYMTTFASDSTSTSLPVCIRAVLWRDSFAGPALNVG